MRSVHARLALAAAFAASPLVGCASYQRVEPAAAPVAGAPIRVSLTDAASLANGPIVGARAQSLQGRLLSTDSSGLSMSVMEVTRYSGADEPIAVDNIHLASSDIDRVEVRRISKSRSTILAVSAVAAAVLIRTGLGSIHDAGGRGVGGPTGTQ